MDAQDRLSGFAEEFAAGNWERLPEFFSHQFFTFQPGADEPGASEQILAIVTDLRAAMPDLTATLDDITTDGGAFAATMTLAGTHENPLWGAPGSGRRIAFTNPVAIKPVGDAFALRFDDVAFPEVIAVLREFGMVNPPDEMDQPPPYPVSLPDFLVKVVFTGQAGDKKCEHLEQIKVTEPSTRLCAQCFAEGTNWPALRMCLICGFVGCCDTSKNKHMLAHHEETGHAIMRSIRMDEGWMWCYADSAFFETRTLDRYR
jgi:predicted ester cyclase